MYCTTFEDIHTTANAQYLELNFLKSIAEQYVLVVLLVRISP